MKLITLMWLLICCLPAAWASNGPAAARVNGEEISQFRLERYFAEYLEDQGRAVASIRNPKAYRQLRRAALDALIDRELLWQESRKRGVRIDEQTLQQQINQTRTALGGAEPFSRRLQEAGFDEASYRDYLRRELAAQQMFAELLRQRFTRTQQMLIKVAPDADAATQAQAQLRLMQMRASVIASAGFVSATVRSPFGWHLIYLENHWEASDVSRMQGLESVGGERARQQQAQARRQVLAQLRAQNRIERIDDD